MFWNRAYSRKFSCVIINLTATYSLSARINCLFYETYTYAGLIVSRYIRLDVCMTSSHARVQIDTVVTEFFVML